VQTDATPAICDSTLAEIRKEFVPVCRPKPGDELGDAEAIIRAHQDSPARAAMPANLAALHAKP
jgi:hypothetical protein